MGKFTELDWKTIAWRLFAASVALCAVLFLNDRIKTLVDRVRDDLNQQSIAIATLTRELRIAVPYDGSWKHFDVREATIRSQLSRVSGAIVMIGDSITEAALFPSDVCGHPVVNAGIGGAWTDFYRQLAPSLLGNGRVALAVVALGTHDTGKGAAPDLFSASYVYLLDALARHADRSLLVGLPPLDMSLPLAKTNIDPALSQDVNGRIASIAAARHLGFVDLRAAMAADGLTVDGVHLNAAGYERWTMAIVGAMTKVLGCKTAQN
jgi:hypothetical protein